MFLPHICLPSVPLKQVSFDSLRAQQDLLQTNRKPGNPCSDTLSGPSTQPVYRPLTSTTSRILDSPSTRPTVRMCGAPYIARCKGLVIFLKKETASHFPPALKASSTTHGLSHRTQPRLLQCHRQTETHKESSNNRNTSRNSAKFASARPNRATQRPSRKERT